MFILVLLCVIGLAMNLMKNWSETRRAHVEHDHPTLSFLDYVKIAPAQTALAILAAIGTFIALAEGTEWMNPITALSCGYVGHSLASGIARTVPVFK